MEKGNKNEGRDRTNAGINYQDGGHQEGQQNNTTPTSGQPSSHNTTSSISEMGNQPADQSGRRMNADEGTWEQQDKP